MSHRAVWALAVLALAAAPAQAANVISFDPVSETIAGLPGQVTLDLEMNFDDETSGGGLRIDYDPAVVTLSGIVFDGALPDDPDFRCPGSSAVPCPGDTNFVSLGAFDGITGGHRIAGLVFDAVAEGATTVSATIVNDFDDGTGSALPVSIESGSILVPEPGAIPMFAVGGLAISWLARRRRRSA